MFSWKLYLLGKRNNFSRVTFVCRLIILVAITRMILQTHGVIIVRPTDNYSRIQKMKFAISLLSENVIYSQLFPYNETHYWYSIMTICLDSENSPGFTDGMKICFHFFSISALLSLVLPMEWFSHSKCFRFRIKFVEDCSRSWETSLFFSIAESFSFMYSSTEQARVHYFCMNEYKFYKE